MNFAAAPGIGSERRRLGRFELRRVLGEGAQATVWLAFDPRLEREVALKLLARGGDSAAISQWLHEARAVSRLTHPHIVPVFEADEDAGQPYMVFEYVSGGTLAALLARRGALPAAEAVTLMLGVLDALRMAHGHGIVHRDLKPSNILLDADGRARVMDFGIAARVREGERHERLVVGTPGYLSPEAARGEPPAPAMDLFSFGVMLAEMLSGQRLLRERDPYRALHRVIHEDLVLPPAQIDDRLRAIVQRTLARDPAQRPASALELHQDLARWLQPPDQAGAAGANGHGTLEFLLRRMKHRTDFPALSDAIARVQRVANSEHENLNSLANEILRDVALTNKLLRLVNTAYYSPGGGAISTVSRAVALVGFAGIRNMALSLMLLEHMNDKAHAQQLKEEFLRALMAGTLAHELCAAARDTEEAFIGAMFQNLGRLLAAFYFPEEAQQIRELARAPARANGATPASEDAAALRVLGIRFEDLGIGVARAWGLPESLQSAMRRPTEDAPPRAPERGPQRLRWLGVAANEVADAMMCDDPQASQTRLSAVVKRYGRALGLDERSLQAAQAQARVRLTRQAEAMGLRLAPQSPARRLLEEAPAPAQDDDDPLATLQLQATATLPPPPEPVDLPLTDAVEVPERAPAVPPPRVAELLAAGIQDVTNHMVADHFRLNEVLRMILETMYRALGFRRVVFCLREAKAEVLAGRFGLGEGVEAVTPVFRIPLRAQAPSPPDLFSAVCLKGVDTLIADATVPHIATRLPAWFRAVGAPSFLLLPLQMKGAPFALIYADPARPGALVLGEKELSMLRTLRNQAVMAFRQAG